MRSSSIQFTGMGTSVISEIPVVGDSTAAHTKYTEVYRVTNQGSFLACRIPLNKTLSTYPFTPKTEPEDDDDLTPHGSNVGVPLGHPADTTILPEGTALQILDSAYNVEGIVHADPGYLKLVYGEELTVTKDKARGESTIGYPVEPGSEIRLQPDGTSLPCGSTASHSTRGGWKMA